MVSKKMKLKEVEGRNIPALLNWIIVIIYEKETAESWRVTKCLLSVCVCVSVDVGVLMTFWNLQIWFHAWGFQTLYRLSTLEKIFILSIFQRTVCVSVCEACEQMDLLWRMKLLCGLILAVAVLVLAEGHSVESGCQNWSNGKNPKEVCCQKCHSGEICKGLNSGIKWLIKTQHLYWLHHCFSNSTELCLTKKLKYMASNLCLINCRSWL